MSGLELAPLVSRLDELLASLNREFSGAAGGLTSEARLMFTDLRATVQEARALLARLDGEGGSLDRVVTSLEGAGDRVGEMATKASDLIERVDGLALRAEGALEETDLAGLSAELRTLAQRVGDAADEAGATMSSLGRTSANSEGLPAETVAALAELRLTLQSVRRLADFFERQPGALLRGRRQETSSPATTPRDPR